MSKLTTAEEFLNYYTKQSKGTIRTAMIEFAKMHVKAALKNFVIMENDRIKDHRTIHKLTEDSVKYIYPLENIK